MTSFFANNFGALDIGSNGVRLLIGRIDRRRMQILFDQRFPIRLGKDSFIDGRISRGSVNRLVHCFLEFRHQCYRHGVLHFQAVATSALRDAKNKEVILRELWRRTGIELRLIDGLEEARLLHKAIQHVFPLHKESALLFDLGGGSLEVLSHSPRRIRQVSSLRVGTVRLLQKLGPDAPYRNYQKLIHRNFEKLINESTDPAVNLVMPEHLIGVGGNLRALGRIYSRIHRLPPRTFLYLSELEEVVDLVFKFSLGQRRRHLRLKPNRADVIRPAAAITLELMRVFNFGKVQTPNIGLKNGILWDLVERVQTNHAQH